MADYQLTKSDMVVRASDKAWIPADPANRDYAEYLKWVEAGGVADPYVEPPPPPPSVEQTIAFDHENRILALEGQPPLTMEDFVVKMRGV